MRISNCIFATVLALVCCQVQAADEYVIGSHYLEVSPAQATSVEDQVEVVEMFWYGCPHCYTFEPYVEKWISGKSDDVTFVRIPAVFSRSWEPHARAYYTAQALGVLEQTHKPLFDAIHRDQQPLHNEDNLARFFSNYGVSVTDFRKVYNSFSVDGKVSRARQLSRAYGITGVPAVIVNGKYRTSASAAGSYDDLLKVIDQLVDKERGEVKATSAP